MLEIGKLYRHHRTKTHPGMPIWGLFVKRVNYNYDNGMYGWTWTGSVLTVEEITEYADAMLLVEFSHEAEGRAFAIFLVGDRFVSLNPNVVEPV